MVSSVPETRKEIIKKPLKIGISGKIENDGKVSGTKKNAAPMIVYAKKTGHGVLLG
jgi:hypothetical protein